jgi:hypothetical protein
MGSSFGMFPAVEMTLRLDRIRAAQQPVPAAVGAAFGPSTYGTNLLPFDAAWPTHRPRLAERRTAGDGGTPPLSQVDGGVAEFVRRGRER